MLETHHFAVDPFSERRLISSVGGGYFLQTFVIAATSISHIAMADRTLGLILLAVALFDLGTSFGLATYQIALLEFGAYLVPQETINLTYVVLPVVMLLSMIWLLAASLEDAEKNHKKHAILVGIIGGSILSLKSTYLPIIGTLSLIPYVVLFWKTRRSNTFYLPVLAGFGSFLVVIAWMLAMKHASDTYLFPVLGHGLDYSRYGHFQSHPRFLTARSMVKIFLQAIALIFLAGIQFYSDKSGKRSLLCIAVLVASAFAITAFNYESGGDFVSGAIISRSFFVRFSYCMQRGGRNVAGARFFSTCPRSLYIWDYFTIWNVFLL